MEELRSTEVLDSEIRNETKKKAQRIVDKAKESAAALIFGVDAKVKEAQTAAKEASEKRLALFTKNINAALPLEKQRYSISFIHNSILEAINSYLEKAGEDGRLKIIKALALRVKGILSSYSHFQAKVINLDENKAKEMLEELFGKGSVSISKASLQDSQAEELELLKYHDGIILLTDDKKIKCFLTLDEKIKEVIDAKKRELALALFDGRLPQ